MAAKKREKLADFVEVYLPDSDTPVRVHKEMYDDPEEWKDAVRRAEKLKVEREQEAYDEGVTDEKPSKMPDEEAGEPKMPPAAEAAEEAGEEPHVTAQTTEPRELTDEEVGRESPNFDPTQYNMGGSRKTPEEQATFAKADRTISETPRDVPETSPTETIPEDADVVASKTSKSSDPDEALGLAKGSAEALGSDASLENFRKSKTISDTEAKLLSKVRPADRADFLLKRITMRENNPTPPGQVEGKPEKASEPLSVDLMDLPLLGGVASPNQALGAAKSIAGFAGGQMPQTPPAPGAPVAAPPGTPAGTPPAASPAPAPGMASMSVKSTKPGAIPRAPSDGVVQAMTDAEALRDGAARLAADAEAKKADITRQSLINQKALQEKAMTDQQHIAEQRAAAEAAYSKSLSDGQAAMSSLMAERRQLLTQRVDPDRYWNQAGAGRKVASVLAGALFGWAGQGMDYLQYLRGLVNDDIKLQQDELRRRGDTMDALVGDQKNIIALAKDKGMTDLEAVEAAKAARFAELKAQLEILTTESGIKQVNPTLSNTLAGLAKEQATAMENAGKFRQQKAVQDAQVQQGWARVNQEKRELAFRMSRERESGQEMKPQQTARISQLLNMGSQLKRLADSYNENVLGGVTGSVGAKVSQHFGLGMSATKGAQWRNQIAKQFAQNLGYGFEGGKQTDKDFDKYLEAYIPSVNDTEEAAEGKMRAMADYGTDKYAAEYNTLNAAQVRSVGLPTPEQYRSHLLQSMGLREKEPLPGETVRE